ncbi:HAMP domain-containing protein [Azospirillum agricola]|uniref:HAMP domain-containing protein n=1 Tax=Azospirillum agricola TaxID=1720247 RepID=UPI001AEB0AC3|nr:HAMP domain-containing protein [Azospirillum agricola]MBP2230380.1 HAMP domain-containing protein [Azospirillum agricola]
MTASSPRRDRLFSLGLPAVVLLAALLTMAGVGLLGTLLAQEQLGEARAAKAAAVAEAVQHDLQRAIGHGIPLDRMEGVAAYLQGIAGRNPDLGFLAVTGADGGRLHAVLPDASRLDAARFDALAASLRGLAPPASREAAIQPIARDDRLVVRLPLRAAATAGTAGTAAPVVGHVLVGVEPEQVRRQIAGELAVVGMGAAAILLLLAEIAGAMAQASVRAPLDRLARVMRAAAAGDFGTLIGRRPRDQLGRALFAFNAAVFRLHDRRQRFAAHAEEVRAAVFDPEVARAVETTRRDALAALGPGLETAPRRVADARAVDARAFAALAAAAATLLTLAGGVGPLAALPVLLGSALAFRVDAAWRRLAALAVAAATALAALPLAGGGSLAGLDPLSGGLSGGLVGGLVGGLCGGLAAGLALAYARRQAGEGTPLVLRSIVTGVAAALLWSAALGWDAAALAGSALVPALLAVPMARSFVVPRR